MSVMGYPRISGLIFTNAKLKFSTTSAVCRSHYDTLGITPKATQNDIKSAYYKLTKMYHPDRNTSEEAKVKFRSITDAYEVLGNYNLRKLYDRGIQPGLRYSESRTPREKKHDDVQARFYESRLFRDKVPVEGGRTPIYNFDEWAKAHYGDLFQQNLAAKRNLEQKEEQRIADDVDGAKLYYLHIPICMIIFLSFNIMYTAYQDKKYYDTNHLASDKKTSND